MNSEHARPLAHEFRAPVISAYARTQERYDWHAERAARLSRCLSPLESLLRVGSRLFIGGDPHYYQQRVVGKDLFLEFEKVKSLKDLPNGEMDIAPNVTKDRLTPYGRLLRGTKIDELPQLGLVAQHASSGLLLLTGSRPRMINDEKNDIKRVKELDVSIGRRWQYILESEESAPRGLFSSGDLLIAGKRIRNKDETLLCTAQNEVWLAEHASQEVDRWLLRALVPALMVGVYNSTRHPDNVYLPSFLTNS